MDTGTIILILSFAVPILIAGGIVYFVFRGLRKGKKFADELRERMDAARPATAEVLNAEQGITGGDINRIIHLKLNVSDGFTQPYIANATWFVNTLHFDKIRAGNAIMVKVDAKNKNIIYPAETWARYTEGYEKLKVES